MTSQPSEDERAFLIRLQQAARERRDAAVADLRRKYAPKLASLQDRRRRAAQTTEQQSGQVGQHAVQAGISMVATAVGVLFGRKRLASTLGRATTAARGMGRTMREREDVARAKENEAAIDQQIAALDAELASAIAAIEARIDADASTLGTLTLAPKKSHITVRQVALAWVEK
jgi:hypothetical protein